MPLPLSSLPLQIAQFWLRPPRPESRPVHDAVSGTRGIRENVAGTLPRDDETTVFAGTLVSRVPGKGRTGTGLSVALLSS